MESVIKWKLEDRIFTEYCWLIFGEKLHLQILVLPAGGRYGSGAGFGQALAGWAFATMND